VVRKQKFNPIRFYSTSFFASFVVYESSDLIGFDKPFAASAAK